MTLNSSLNTQQQELENIITPESLYQQNLKQEKLGQNVTNRSLIGDYWEYWVALTAIDKGAQVFRNLICVGDIDMILKIGDLLVPIDVKQKTFRAGKGPRGGGGYHAAKGYQIPEGIFGVGVHPITKEVSWYKVKGSNQHHVIAKRCPPGLETFWDD